MSEIRFRQSLLKQWMACSLQAKFSSIDKLPRRQNAKASFGTIIHACLERYQHTGDVEAAVEMFLDNWHNPEKLGVTPEYWPRFTSFGSLRQRGIEILRSYHDSMRWDEREVIATEHRFLVPFGRHELEGTADLLEVRRSGKGKTLLRVCDFKTNTRKPSFAELALDIQFTVYVYASMQREFWVGNGPDFPGLPNGEWLFETLKELPRRGIWIHLWDNAAEIDAGGRDQTDFERLYRLCEEIERAIDAQVFVPSIGSACGICDFADGPCPVAVPAAPLSANENAWI